jgi:flagellar protein FliO/FliZ
VILETLFGEGSTGLKVVIALVAVPVLLAIAFWLVRRFGGGRLGSGASRGRQPRLAVIDQVVVDRRHRLILVRRDNVEHLLIIGGPTDVVVEQNILRAAATVRDAAPVRPAAAPPEGAPRVEPSATRLEPSPIPAPPPSAAPAPPVAESAALGRRRVGEWSRVRPALEPATPEPRPAAPAVPPVPPVAADASSGPLSDQNLSEMAQRLEAALRRPTKSADKTSDKPSGPPKTRPSTEDAAPAAARRINAWIEGGMPPLQVNRAYRLGLNIGRLRAGGIAAVRFIEPQQQYEATLDLLVVVGGTGFRLEPRRHVLALPCRGDSESIFFTLTPLRAATLILCISIYLARELALLQEFEVPIETREAAMVA